MTTQETLAQIEHLLVENERSLRNELSYGLINKLIGRAKSDFIDTIKDSNGEEYKESIESTKMITVINWLKKIKQEMENE
jgi:hypothetical protein